MFMLFLAKEEAVNRRNAPMLLSVPAHPQEFPASSRCSTSQDTGHCDMTVGKHRLMGIKRYCRFCNEQHLEVFPVWRTGADMATCPWGAVQGSAGARDSPWAEHRSLLSQDVSAGSWWWERGGRLSRSQHIQVVVMLDRRNVDSGETSSLIWSTSLWFRL